MAHDPSAIRKFLSETRVLAKPRRALSTFGSTRLDYYLISGIEGLDNRCRLREGTVLAEKPLVLTADALKERFEGFGEGAREFAEWIQQSYRDALRALEYRFKHEHRSTRVLQESPLDAAERIKLGVQADEKGGGVLVCPDAGWQLALMRFSLEEAIRSYPVNVRDIDRRGGFDPEGRERGRRSKEIERLFEEAESDSEARTRLGEKLKDYGVFDAYQDRYLRLFKQP